MAHGSENASVREAAPAEFHPYVPASETPSEFTIRSLVLGSLLGMLFAASSVYLALKVGLTVSASIPIAVMSISIFRAFGRSSILENNITQTTGSAGESIAAGVAFTLPALLLLGQDLETSRILMVALFGGLLGTLMMIPLRQGLIVKEHGKLSYPEGTACAQVLIVGEQGGVNARTVFTGFGVGGLYKFLNNGLHLWKEEPTKTFASTLKGGTIAAEISPEMLGVGYIIGPRVAANMMAGGALAFLILIPLIHIFGDGLMSPMFPSTEKLIRDMSPGEIRNSYVLYIGSGAVATGGIISLIRAFPTIVSAFRRGFQSLTAGRAGATEKRTEQDLSITLVAGGSIALAIAIAVAPVLNINPVSAVLVILFGFFFVTVSSRITGEIGSSSNPISGMTVATLLITCLLFVAVGWTGISYRAMALSTAAIVCVAASVGGATSQDLKTGFLVGGTPRYQQLAIMVGTVTSALVIGLTLQFINSSATTYVQKDYPAYTATVGADAPREAGPGGTYRVVSVPEISDGVPVGRYLVDDGGKIKYLIDPGIGGAYTEGLSQAGNPKKVSAKFDAPKARLFSLIVDGILSRKLPWGLVLTGVMLALMMELCGVASLPFAVGVYLPISTSTPIFVGGLVRYFVERKQAAQTDAEAESSPAVLLSSGLIAGGAIASLLVLLAAEVLERVGVAREAWDLEHVSPLAASDFASFIPFAMLAGFLFYVGRKGIDAVSSRT